MSVAVFGARSMVAEALLKQLAAPQGRVWPVSRQAHRAMYTPDWLAAQVQEVEVLYCCAPIWGLAAWLDQVAVPAGLRVVALSSTSALSKRDAAHASERALAQQLWQAEQRCTERLHRQGARLSILRPTLIHGYGRDQNICQIARWIQRWGFFPLAGQGRGLRQPIHADEVARAMRLAADVRHSGALNVPGGSTLSYRQMVEAVFHALQRPVRVVRLPRHAVALGYGLARQWPRWRHLAPGAAWRMDEDLCFDAGEAEDAIGFRARPFALVPADLPDQAGGRGD